MPISVKAVFTIAIVAMMVALLFVDPNLDNAGPDGFLWRGLKTDPFRRLFFHQDGSLKRFTKGSLWVGAALFLLGIWFLIPTATTLH